jgi:hypothetical protein
MDHCLEPRRGRLEDLKKIEELTVRGADPGIHRTHGGLYDQQQDQAVRDKYCEREAAWCWCRSIDEASAVMLQAADRLEPAKIDAGSRGRLPAHGQIVCADVTNRCLSSATACLYGRSEAAILAARLSAGHWLPSPRQTAELRLRRRASNKQRTKDRDVGNTTSFRQSPFRSY